MEWIITAKPSGKDGYRALEAFGDLGQIHWHKSKPMRGISVNDIVYIYIGVPYSKIMLRTVCLDQGYSPSPEEFNKELIYYNDATFATDSHSDEFLLLKETARIDTDELSLKTLNLKGLVKRNIQGSYCSKNNPELFAYIHSIFNDPVKSEYESLVEEIDSIGEKYRESVAKERLGQGAYRDALIDRYSCKCMLCGIEIRELLIASHIKPFSESSKAESIDVDNGLLLCANHDKLFDRHMISFDNNGEIIISKRLPADSLLSLGIDETMKIPISGRMTKYLQYHRDSMHEKDLKTKQTD